VYPFRFHPIPGVFCAAEQARTLGARHRSVKSLPQEKGRLSQVGDLHLSLCKNYIFGEIDPDPIVA
jgi:hypothetical protein